MPISAVIFDLGGVVFPSPFEAFDRYDERAGLRIGTTRSIIRTSSETGAWAALERGELTSAEFHAALEAEGAAAGHHIDAAKIMATVAEGGGPRPEMITAIRRLRAASFKVGALTNNWHDDRPDASMVSALESSSFDAVIESAKVGLRKPDPAIYELACTTLGVEAPHCVFLDDLGINLKPARAMGMTTIKVSDPITALRELAEHVNIELL